jgi:hypothetical protein
MEGNDRWFRFCILLVVGAFMDSALWTHLSLIERNLALLNVNVTKRIRLLLVTFRNRDYLSHPSPFYDK